MRCASETSSSKDGDFRSQWKTGVLPRILEVFYIKLAPCPAQMQEIGLFSHLDSPKLLQEKKRDAKQEPPSL